MTTEVFPLNTKLLAAEVKKARKSESGIILEGTKSMNETAAARIIAVGPDVDKLKVGDTVYLDWAKTKLIIVDGAQRVLLDQEDIYGIVVES